MTKRGGKIENKAIHRKSKYLKKRACPNSELFNDNKMKRFTQGHRYAKIIYDQCWMNEGFLRECLLKHRMHPKQTFVIYVHMLEARFMVRLLPYRWSEFKSWMCFTSSNFSQQRHESIFSIPIHPSNSKTLGSLALLRQPISIKDNSEFKQVLLRW